MEAVTFPFAKVSKTHEIEEIAGLLGARIVGQVPDVGGGDFAAEHLAKIYQLRMAELRCAQYTGADMDHENELTVALLKEGQFRCSMT